MSYTCYIFDHAHELINSVEHFKQQGGQLEEIRILIKDVEHGSLLASAGLHHIDYLSEITTANHLDAHSNYNEGEAPYFVGLTTGQNVPGVINGFLHEEDSHGLDALEAYGLSDSSAEIALYALREGKFLLFSAEEAEVITDDPLTHTLSASFGEKSSSDAPPAKSFYGASQIIKV